MVIYRGKKFYDIGTRFKMKIVVVFQFRWRPNLREKKSRLLSCIHTAYAVVKIAVIPTAELYQIQPACLCQKVYKNFML
jgi:hypothetical protein